MKILLWCAIFAGLRTSKIKYKCLTVQLKMETAKLPTLMICLWWWNLEKNQPYSLDELIAKWENKESWVLQNILLRLWFQSFSFRRPVVLPFIHSWVKKRQTIAFPKGINLKSNTVFLGFKLGVSNLFPGNISISIAIYIDRVRRVNWCLDYMKMKITLMSCLIQCINQNYLKIFGNIID